MRRALAALALSGCSVFLEFDDPLVDAPLPADAQVDTGPDAADGFEPNDTLETAAALAAGGTFSPLSIRPAGDRDFFRFATSGAAATKVEIAFTHAAGDLDLRLHDAAGGTPYVSDGAADGETIEAPLAAGEWTAEVYGAAGIQENDYSLVLTLP